MKYIDSPVRFLISMQHKMFQGGKTQDIIPLGGPYNFCKGAAGWIIVLGRRLPNPALNEHRRFLFNFTTKCMNMVVIFSVP